MVNDDTAQRRRSMAKAYAEALRQLRWNHDDEFHSLLNAIYENTGMTVRTRRSRAAMEKIRSTANVAPEHHEVTQETTFEE